MGVIEILNVGIPTCAKNHSLAKQIILAGKQRYGRKRPTLIFVFTLLWRLEPAHASLQCQYGMHNMLQRGLLPAEIIVKSLL